MHASHILCAANRAAAAVRRGDVEAALRWLAVTERAKELRLVLGDLRRQQASRRLAKTARKAGQG